MRLYGNLTRITSAILRSFWSQVTRQTILTHYPMQACHNLDVYADIVYGENSTRNFIKYLLDLINSHADLDTRV